MNPSLTGAAVASAMAGASMAPEKEKEAEAVPAAPVQGSAKSGTVADDDWEPPPPPADTPEKKKKASPNGTSQKKGKKRGAEEAVITITGDEDNEPIANLRTKPGPIKRRSSRLQAGISKP